MVACFVVALVCFAICLFVKNCGDVAVVDVVVDFTSNLHLGLTGQNANSPILFYNWDNLRLCLIAS